MPSGETTSPRIPNRLVDRSPSATRGWAVTAAVVAAAVVVAATGASAQTTPAPPVLPQLLNLTYPVITGHTIRARTARAFQRALDDAHGGDQIVLPAGVTFTGNFVLPAKACGAGWIVVRSETSDAQLPPPGTRLTPSAAPLLAKLVSPNTAPALATAARACRWWISRVEITASGTPPVHYGLVRLGNQEPTLAEQPTDLVLDRAYVHGTPTLNLQRCVALNSARTAIIDSWVSDCHWKGGEAQAVAGWSGAGPYKIVNNYLEGSGINLMFGGADPSIRNLTPSDIEIRGNYLFKPKSWKGVWTVKNLLELKHAKRVLIEGNVMENSWADAQIGWGLFFQSLTDNPQAAPWTATSDITMRYNVVRNVNGGLSLAAHGWNGSGIAMTRVAIEHNVFDNIGGDQLAEGIRLLQDLSDIRVAHNTILRNTETMGVPFMVDRGSATASRVAILDNVSGSATPYGAVFMSGGAQGGNALQSYTNGSWAFAGNVVWRLESSLLSAYPSGNYWPATQSGVGFSTDYSLSSGSPYKAKATDGTDPGVNVTQLNSLIASVTVR